MSKKNNTQTKQKKSVRAIALVLAFLMLAGAATVIFSIIGSLANSGDDHEGHDHAAIVYTQNV